MRRILLIGLLSPALATGQTIQGPASLSQTEVGAFLERLGPSLFSDSAAAQLHHCVEAGVEVTRGAIVRRILEDQTARRDEAEPVGEHPWMATLSEVGLLSPPETEWVRLFLGVDSSQIREIAALPEVLLQVAEVVDRLDHNRRSQLEPASDVWKAVGLLTEDAQERLLEDAEAGRLGLIGSVVPYLATASPVGQLLTDHAPNQPAPRAVDLRDILAAVNLHLDTPWEIGEVRIDSVTTIEREGTSDERSWTTWTLSAEVDGQVYRREAGAFAPVSDLAPLVNQILRDQTMDLRIGIALEGRVSPRVQIQPHVVLLSPRQLELLTPDPEQVGLESGFKTDDLADLEARIAALPPDCRDLLPDLRRQNTAWVGWEATPDVSSGPTTADAREFFRTLASTGILHDHDPDSLAASFLASFPGPLDPWQDWAVYVLPSDMGVFFDLEGTQVPPEYEGVTDELAALTGGAWTPDSVTVRPSGEHVDYGFRVDGQTYHTRLSLDGDWFDLGFLGLIAQSVEETVPDGSFYWLGDSILFLTGAQVGLLDEIPGFERLEQVTGLE